MCAGVGVLAPAGGAEQMDRVAVLLGKAYVLGQLQLSGDTCLEQRRRVGLADVIGRACLQPEAFVVLAVARTHEQNRDGVAGRLLLERARHRIAVHVRQFDIQQDELGRVARHRIQGVAAGFGEHQREVVAQQLAQGGQVAGFVVDTQQGAGRHGGSLPRLGGARSVQVGRLPLAQRGFGATEVEIFDRALQCFLQRAR